MSAEAKALRIAIAFAFPCLTLLCAHVFFDPLYRTNDDPTMLLIAAGEVYTDQPSPYLAFSNHLWGALVAFFYRWFPGAPWYRLFQLVVQVGAGATLAYLALGKRVTVGRLLPIAAYFAVFDMLMSIRPQFTLTAAVAAIAAVALSWDRCFDPERRGAARWTWFIALWAAAAMIRHESAVLVLLLSAPPALVPLHDAWRNGRLRDGIRRVGLPLLVAAAVVASLHAYNALRYRSPEWRDYTETGPAIGSIIDFGAAGSARSQTWLRFPDGRVWLDRVEYTPEIYAAAADGPGWTRHELHMLMEWFYADTELYSLERVRQFLERVGEPPPRSAGPLEPLRKDPNLALLLLAIVVGWSFRSLDFRAAARFAAVVLTALAWIAYVDLGLQRLLSWVYEPVFAFTGWSLLMLGRERPLVRRDRFWFVTRALALGVFASLLLAAGTRIAGESASRAARHHTFTEAVRSMDPDPGQLYVSWADSFPQELLGPFDDLEPYRDLDFYFAAGATRGGHNRRQLERFGIADIHRAIYEDPRVRVLSRPRQNRVLTGFVRERYGADIVAERLGSYPDEAHALFEVYRFSAATAAD